MLFFFFIPIHISVASLELKLGHIMGEILRTVGIFISFLDVIVSMNTAYSDKGIFERNRKKVIKFYF